MADGVAPQDIARMVADHHQALYRYAYRLTGSAPDAEDFTQQVFLIAQQKSGQLRNVECERGWLFTILRNCYLKSQRQRLPLPMAHYDFDINAVPEAIIESNVDSERLQAAINALGDEFKLVVLMFYFEHRSYRDIAEALNLPPGTVMSRLARAKNHLRHFLCEAQEHSTIREDSMEVGGSRTAFREPRAVRR